MGEKEVDAFIQQTAAVQAEKGYGELTRWYFTQPLFESVLVVHSKQVSVAKAPLLL